MRSHVKSVVVLICGLLFCVRNCVGETGKYIIHESLTYRDNDTEVIKIQEVNYGKTAVLRCRSNDKEHLFLFWQLAKNDTVVGPGNIYDDFKYDYEILTGNLIIYGVSAEEEGTYNCVSRGVKVDDINIRSVRMIVKQDWAEVDAHDPGLNYFRGVVVLASLMVIGGVAYYVYRLRRRHRLQTLLEEEDDEDDSAEEIFRAPGTSKGNIVVNRIEDPEIPRISTDFEDILVNTTS